MLNLYIVPAICFALSLIVIGFILLKNEKITNVVSYAIMFSGVVSIISYILKYIMINHVVHM